MIDFENVDLDAPVEPYQFKVGDRVRATAAISECNVPGTCYLQGEFMGERDHCHNEIEAGHTGTVVPFRHHEPVFGHTIDVDFDEPFHDGIGRLMGAQYAPFELEPA